MIDEVALDKYLYIRDAYLQRHARSRGDEDSAGGGRGKRRGGEVKIAEEVTRFLKGSKHELSTRRAVD
jgi:ABC-type transporter lipoprotein component MlaA